MVDSAVVEYRLDRLDEAMIQSAESIRMISDSLSKLAILEERHNETRVALDRCFAEQRQCKDDIAKRLLGIEEQIDAMEKASRHWPDLILTLLISGVVAASVAKVFG